MVSSQLVESFLDASQSVSSKCLDQILTALRVEYDLKAASFYSYLEATKILTLRSQNGFSYSDYKSFELDLESTAGAAISAYRAKFSEDLENEPGYRDQILIKKYGLKYFAAIALRIVPEISDHIADTKDHIAVLCLYPKNSDSLNSIKLSEKELEKLVSRTYQYSVRYDRTVLRHQLVEKAVFNSKDLNSFASKALQLLKTEWGIEASSIYIFDKRNDTLYLRASTGVVGNPTRQECTYSTYEDSKQKTVRCYLNGRIEFLLKSTEEEYRSGKFREEISNVSPKSIVYMPIFEPHDPYNITSEPERTGVLRSVNRVVENGDNREICSHGWEDLSLIEFLASFLGIMREIYKEVDATNQNFDRALHGITRPLTSAKRRVNKLKRLLKGQYARNSQQDRYLRNSGSYLEAVDWQISKHTDRFDGGAKIIQDEVKFYGEVLSKLVALAEDNHESFNVKNLTITNLKLKGAERMPTVFANSKALNVVFRNLIDNAMKYHKQGEDCRIDVDWQVVGDQFLEVLISDWGIGIDEKRSYRLFREGYRSEIAKRIDPPGTGIGLADSRSIMERMKGKLEIENFSNPTTFKVSIRKFNRRAI
jgi:hypothetical protein